jgi:Bacterial membrane protein YfhO
VAPVEAVSVPGSLRFPAWAGPALIVGSVLIVLHGFWLFPKLTYQQVDLLAFWLPRWCHLGTSLADGHLPTWLPSQFGGVPFLSDPQSGWLYLPAMFLFSVTSCARALGLVLTLHPILAGLGIYAFLRQERIERAGATVGGLTLALSLAGGAAALSIPFSGTVAWTALTLAGAAGFVHADGWARRLAWLALIELGLTQVAAVHLTDGLAIAALVVGLYLLARSFVQIRTGERSMGAAAVQVVLPFLVFPLLAAAVLLPRLLLLSRTSIGRGYEELGRLAAMLSGTRGSTPFAAHGVGPWWGTALARGPGGYVGALAILLVPIAFASRRFRWPALAFGVAGLLGWTLNLNVLVASRSVREVALNSKLGELWLRDPLRFRHLLPLALAALAGYGVQAWLDRSRNPTANGFPRRMLWLVPSVVVFAVVPLIAGSDPPLYVPLLAGMAALVPLLWATAKGKRWAVVAIPVVVALELAAVGLIGQNRPIPPPPRERTLKVPSQGLGKAFASYRTPFIDPASYLTPGAIGRTIQREGGTGRVLTFVPEIARESRRGFLHHQGAEDWPAYENGRSILFGFDEVQGYSPVQMPRYWDLIRRVDQDAPIFYNSATFQRLEPSVLRLFATEWVIQRANLAPPVGADPVAEEGRYVLYRLRDPTPRASAHLAWERVGANEGLDTVLDPAFGLDGSAIVEGGPPPPPRTPASAAATIPASYVELDPERVRVQVDTPAQALVVVRNAYDANWEATIDGRPAPVLMANYLMQGVIVPPGRHVVELTYRDRPIAVGLALSGLAWGALAAGWAVVVVRGRRRARPGSPIQDHHDG